MARRADTATRIRLTAERLFARRGLDDVSIRDITAAAGVSTSSLYHHFGSKAALVEAILDQRVHELLGRRAELVASMGGPDGLTLRQVVVALVVPTAEMAGDRRGGAANYVRFLGAVMAHRRYAPLIARVVPHAADELALLEPVTPQLTTEERALRFAVAKSMLNQVLGEPGHALQVWMDAHPVATGPDLAEHLVDFLVGAFASPMGGDVAGAGPDGRPGRAATAGDQAF